MAYVPRILAFSGSSRRGSLNKQVLRVALTGARDAGAEVTEIDLREFALPLYDGDLEAEQGLPEGVMALKALFQSHDGLLIASPEYNSTITPLLKNTIDWVSRPTEGETPLTGLRGKVVGLVSASPGSLGGLRGLGFLRSFLENIAMMVIPDQVAVGEANQYFDERGLIQDTALEKRLRHVGSQLAMVVGKLHR
jgi:NAD(P)H-dependent FMN reductase